jgi:hypothetical protein
MAAMPILNFICHMYTYLRTCCLFEKFTLLEGKGKDQVNVTKINITYSTWVKLLLFLFKHVKVNILIYIHVDLYNDSMAAMPILNLCHIDLNGKDGSRMLYTCNNKPIQQSWLNCFVTYLW